MSHAVAIGVIKRGVWLRGMEDNEALGREAEALAFLLFMGHLFMFSVIM